MSDYYERLRKLLKDMDWRQGYGYPDGKPLPKKKKKVNTQRRKRLALLRKYKRCYWCKLELTEATATIDHRKPLSRGGTNQSHNLVLCCYPCNQSKGDLMPWEWRAQQEMARAAEIEAGVPEEDVSVQVLPLKL